MSLLKIRRLLWCLGVVSFCLLPQVGQAFGVSPVSIEVNHLRSDSSAAVTFYISRANPITEDQAQISIVGSGSTAIIQPATEIVLPIGEAMVAFPITIQPSTLAPGTYTSEITFIYEPSVETPLLVNSVKSGVVAQLIFTVTMDTVRDLTIDTVQLKSRDTDSTPPTLTYSMTNRGNIADGPEQVNIIYTDVATGQTLSTSFTKDQLPTTAPFSSDVMELVLSTDLPDGLYQLTVQFYNQEQILLYTSDTLHLQIPNNGRAVAVVVAETTSPTTGWLWLVGGGIIVAGTLGSWIWYTRSIKQPKS